MRRPLWWIVFAAIVVMFAGSLYLYALSWRPAEAAYDVQGVDVSAANGAVDWAAVKAAGAQFGYLAATNGTDRDAAFEDNWRGTASAGLRRGAIHRWSLCKSAVEQANNFSTTVPKADDALPPALSLDLTADCNAAPDRAALIADLRRYLSMVEANMQRPVILLVSRAFEAKYAITDALNRPIWSVQNFVSPGYAARPWRMWRASDMRRIDGVTGPVNWDVVAK